MKISEEDIIFVVAHVDDTLSIGSRRDVDNTKAQLAKKFKTKDMGPGKVFIGLNIKWDSVKREIY